MYFHHTGREVVFQCRDEGPARAPVRWTRGSGLALPPSTRDVNGRLEMPNIQPEHTGTYICEAIGYPATTPGARVSVYLKVDACKYFLFHHIFSFLRGRVYSLVVGV